ncbi:MAG: class I SAM-dependent methyltransferase [Mediterranea sp.]|jgi:2-polyprenyl-3-methyl-5-hydroxy-6-metoxy-1,4-benzoquinol methylase|nr:class I SAM-dependent methyltransferase [Mediterranea sp.]
MKCTDFYASGEQFDIYACKDCDFHFTQEAPHEAEMDRYYEASRYISLSDSRKGIVNMLYHWVRDYTLSQKAKLVMKEAHRRTGRILDIGAGTGHFADIMAYHEWTVNAIEKNAKARAFAKEYFELDIKDENALYTFKPDSFNVITLWHVMEHLEHLNDIWERVYELLTDKGILVVAVPNRASYDAQKYKEHWAAYDVPRHLWHFTPVTIEKWGYKHGFVLANRYPMPFDVFYISILSEKYRKSFSPLIKGMFMGIIGWFHAQSHKDKSSSMIYVFRKKQHED